MNVDPIGKEEKVTGVHLKNCPGKFTHNMGKTDRHSAASSMCLIVSSTFECVKHTGLWPVEQFSAAHLWQRALLEQSGCPQLMGRGLMTTSFDTFGEGFPCTINTCCCRHWSLLFYTKEKKTSRWWRQTWTKKAKFRNWSSRWRRDSHCTVSISLILVTGMLRRQSSCRCQ